MTVEQKAVYVCEDELDLFRAIERELADRYRVVHSEDGAEAVAAAQQGRALLIVMDRKLKNGADGVELVSRLRASGDRTPC